MLLIGMRIWIWWEGEKIANPFWEPTASQHAMLLKMQIGSMVIRSLIVIVRHWFGLLVIVRHWFGLLVLELEQTCHVDRVHKPDHIFVLQYTKFLCCA